MQKYRPLKPHQIGDVLPRHALQLTIKKILITQVSQYCRHEKEAVAQQ
jgi:hypothetical protein